MHGVQTKNPPLHYKLRGVIGKKKSFFLIGWRLLIFGRILNLKKPLKIVFLIFDPFIVKMQSEKYFTIFSSFY